MRLKSPAIVGMVAAGALLLAACGSSSNSSGTTSAAASDTAGAAASGSASGTASAVGGKIGVILPDTNPSTRWENQDRPASACIQGCGRRLRHPECQR